MQNADLTEDEASRLWAGFGAYWLSLLFFGTITCLYQWCVEVCVNDANLFKDIAIANAKSKDGVVSSVSHELRYVGYFTRRAQLISSFTFMWKQTNRNVTW